MLFCKPNKIVQGKGPAKPGVSSRHTALGFLLFSAVSADSNSHSNAVKDDITCLIASSGCLLFFFVIVRNHEKKVSLYCLVGFFDSLKYALNL